MIRVILQGRTGNNLFQYAAGRALAIRHDTDLQLDVSWSGPDRAQMRQIERLPICAKLVNRHSVLKRGIRRLTGIGPQTWHRGTFYEKKGPGPGFREEVMELPDNTLLSGFFHHERYFSGIEPIIRKEIDLDFIELSDASNRTLDLARSGRMTSVHVRRGDYMNIPGTQCVDAAYHTKACDHLRERFEKMSFLVFSDDIAWCRRNFSGNDYHFCDHPEASQDPFHDLRLMASCAHHIIMNSTYSWWGAWLNPSSKKTVIAPKTWMRGVPANQIMPESWILI
jgi:hypothetical protein